MCFVGPQGRVNPQVPKVNHDTDLAQSVKEPKNVFVSRVQKAVNIGL
jgi:hypothetical protein